ncbi:MAG: glycosyltransferase family 9 protein, partial [Acetobacteraceae bacterium]
LAMAGLHDMPAPELGWLEGDVARFALPRRFALLVPGASPHRPEKRWPVDRYAALAAALAARGLASVVVGSAGEAPLAAAIRAACPDALDLCGRTAIADLAPIASRATLAVGNDTGPMHLVAAVGTPSVVLFSAASDPALCAPRGRGVRVLRMADLADLPTDRVLAALPQLDAPSAAPA